MKETSDHSIHLRILLEKPPPGVVFGLQRGAGSQYQVLGHQKSEAGKDLCFELTIQLKKSKENGPAPDFAGPFVQGPVSERFIYINIGTSAGDLSSVWSRRLKVPLRGISWETIDTLLSDPTLLLEARVAGTAKDGGPNCATVKPFNGWLLQ